MTRPRAHRRPASRALLAALAAATATALLAGCGAGFNAPAELPFQPADGVVADIGQLRVLDALVVSPPEGGAGVVVMTIVNRGGASDQLLAVNSPQGQVETSAPATLAGHQSLSLGADSSPAYTIRALTAEPGSTVTLSLVFATSGTLTLRTVVVPATGYYASITPAPEPSESPSGSASPGDTTSPSDTASPSESTSTAGSPTPTTS